MEFVLMARKKASKPKPKAQKTGATGGLTDLWKRHRDHHNAAEAVYMTLREAILHGVLPSGAPLSEIPLADVFGRSRTPIREAILRLESEKLAERVPRRGLVVARITREEVLEVYVVRETLDGLAAQLAAVSISPPDLDRLVWLNDRLRAAVQAGDSKAMTQLNIEFHEAICNASRNTLLQEFMRRIHEWVHRFADTTMALPGRGMEAVSEHEALIEALRARDPEAAERIAHQHMHRARKMRIEMIQSAAGNQTDSSTAARDLGSTAPATG
jgi:DNA-binding GntR family transcriptional regulator